MYYEGVASLVFGYSVQFEIVPIIHRIETAKFIQKRFLVTRNTRKHTKGANKDQTVLKQK